MIIDDHDVVREGIAAVVRRRGDVDDVLFAKTRDEISEVFVRHPDIDLVLLDLALPTESGFSLQRFLSNSWPDVPVLFLSASEDPADVRTAIGRGALGYVPKSAASTTLLTAISVVLEGEIYVPTFALGRLDEREGIETLTDRQAEILALLGQGFSNKTIATRLDLSEKTVKAHLTAVYRAIGVATREEAVKAASRRQPS